MQETTILDIKHIVKTPGNLGGEPRIAGRRIGVKDIVTLHLHLGSSIDEIAESYDLTPAQIHAALSYYYDHPDEIDTLIAEEAAAAARIPDPPEALRQEFERRVQARLEPGYEMTPPEIAIEFGVSEQAVRKAASQGWIPARKAGKIWLIRRSDALARWGESRPT